tara:strand:+ start:4475 stop:5419 length:945 start_codon:yes stop_codon:yes gene_type:complete
MHKTLKILLIIALAPMFMVGCGSLTANSSVSPRNIKSPKTGSMFYVRHSTKTDPNTISQVNDLQDLRLAIKGDVQESTGGVGFLGLKTLEKIFRPTTQANRTFSEIMWASAEGDIDSQAAENIASKVFEVEAAQTDRAEEVNNTQNIEFSTNRHQKVMGDIKETLKKSDKDLRDFTEFLKEAQKELDERKKRIEVGEINDTKGDPVVTDGDSSNLFKQSFMDEAETQSRGSVVLISAEYTGLVKSVKVNGTPFVQSTDWERLPNGKREHWRNNALAVTFAGSPVEVTLEDGTVLSGNIKTTQAGSKFRGTFDLN